MIIWSWALWSMALRIIKLIYLYFTRYHISKSDINFALQNSMKGLMCIQMRKITPYRKQIQQS